MKQKFIFTCLSILLLHTVVSAQVKGLFDDSRYTLTERWELDKSKPRTRFLPFPYKPIYFLPVNWSNNPNESPASLNPDYALNDTIPYNDVEFKFQISIKTKAFQGIFWGHGDLWLAYTQTSRWQVYNADLSRPFRETNYEPEAILNFATNLKLFGNWKASMVGIGFNHQSNGRAVPLSRSWNRIIFHAGFESKNTNIMLRPWIRIYDEVDENPDITKYMGVGELLVSHNWKGHQFTFTGRHSLDFSESHGSFRFDWAIPILNNLKGHFQFFTGYGESMIDYNHKQTTVGLGVSLVEW